MKASADILSLGFAVTLLLVPADATHRRLLEEIPKRVRLSDFTIALTPLITNLTIVDAERVRDAAEELFEEYLENIHWGSTHYAYAGLSGIESVTITDNFASLISIRGGLVVFDGISHVVPTQAQIRMMLQEALGERLTPALKKLGDGFENIDSSVLTFAAMPSPLPSSSPSASSSPSGLPTLEPSTMQPTTSTMPTNAPSSRPSWKMTTMYFPTERPTLEPSTNDNTDLQPLQSDDLTMAHSIGPTAILIAGSVAFALIVFGILMGRRSVRSESPKTISTLRQQHDLHAGLDSLQIPDAKSDTGSSLLGRLLLQASLINPQAQQQEQDPSPSPTPTKPSWSEDDASDELDFDDHRQQTIEPKIVAPGDALQESASTMLPPSWRKSPYVTTSSIISARDTDDEYGRWSEIHSDCFASDVETSFTLQADEEAAWDFHDNILEVNAHSDDEDSFVMMMNNY